MVHLRSIGLRKRHGSVHSSATEPAFRLLSIMRTVEERTAEVDDMNGRKGN